MLQTDVTDRRYRQTLQIDVTDRRYRQTLQTDSGGCRVAPQLKNHGTRAKGRGAPL